MSYTLKDIEKHFGIKEEEGALLFTFLTFLPPGEDIKFINGRIEKITEDTLKLCIDNATYHQVAEGFLIENVDEYPDLFSDHAFDADEA